MPIDLEELERLIADRDNPGSLLGRMGATYDIAEAVPALIAEVRRLRAELDGANAEVVKLKDGWANIRSQLAAARLALEAVTEECMELRAHAAKVKPQCSCSRRLGDYCPDVDRACPLHGDAAKVSR